MTDIANLEAWAKRRGYNPEKDYTAGPSRDEIRDAVAEALANRGSPEPESHFSPAEFACNHCGELPSGGMDLDLIDLLEKIRSHFGDKPITINSGYRCPYKNAECGGASNSQHLYGTAADIVVDGNKVKPSAVYAYLDPFHEGGLGSYDTFTHVDVRGSRARWSG